MTSRPSESQPENDFDGQYRGVQGDSEDKHTPISISAHTPTSTISTFRADQEKQVVLILVGLTASGKSTFAGALERHLPRFRRCNQDELGDRRSVEALARRTLRDGLSVCIDRTNFDESQRAHWVNIAREVPETDVWVIVFDTPYEVCAARLCSRTGHPTITNSELGLQVLRRFQSQYRPPLAHEGYTRILHLRPEDLPNVEPTEQEVREVIRRVQDAPEVVRTERPAPWSGFRGGRGGYNGRDFHQRGPAPRGGYAYPGAPHNRTRGGGDAQRGRGAYQPTSPWNQPPSRGGPPSRGSQWQGGPGGRGWGRGSHEGTPRSDRTERNWRE